jgi:hypothetical protein
VKPVKKKQKKTINQILACKQCCSGFPYLCFDCRTPVFRTLDAVGGKNGKITNNL